MKEETKKNLIKYLGILLLIVITTVGLVILFINRESDAKKFKREYEKLNETVRESDGQTYGTINIDEKNPIKYISAKEAVDILDSEKAIIYFGAPWCPWCRNAIPVLFEVAKQYSVETIYYVELDDIKSTYEIIDNKLVKTKQGTKEYYQLLDKLKPRLKEYTISNGEGQIFHADERRIYMPYVVAVKNGRVVADKIGTVGLDEGQTKYDSLTESQWEQLNNDYQTLFKLVYKDNSPECGDDVCD